MSAGPAVFLLFASKSALKKSQLSIRRFKDALTKYEAIEEFGLKAIDWRFQGR
jgi:hypothetical protein